MDSYEEFLLDATKDSVNVLRGEGSTNKEIVEFLNTATEGIGARSPEFTNEIDTLKRKFERDDIFEQLGTTPAKEVISLAEEKGVDPLRLIRDEKILDLLSEKLEIKADISMMLGDIDRIGDLPSREDDLKLVNGKLDDRVSELTKEVNLDDFEQLISNATKDEIQLTKREEIELDIENLKYDIQSLDAEYMDFDEYGKIVDLRDERYDKELETLEGKLALKEQELASLDKENSLDDLIKGAVEKTEDQPIKNNPIKEMER